MLQSRENMLGCMFILLLLGIASGKSTILYDKLIDCILQPSSNLRETYAQSSMCGHSQFKHCHEDVVTCSGEVAVLQDDCGFIDSSKIDLYTYMYAWLITAKQTVWIDIIEFNLRFFDFPCSVEYVSIKDAAMKKICFVV